MLKISVIIPIYNVEKYIKLCIQSVLSQTLFDFEIILIDNHSTDKSVEIIKSFKDKRIKLLFQNQRSAASARNLGIKNAKGKYLYFLDGDDFIENTFLEKMFNKIEKEQAQICICKCFNYFEKDNKTQIYEKSLNKNSKNPFNIATYQCINKIYLSSFIEENNLFFQNLTSCNDVFFYFSTIALSSKICLVNEALAISRRNRIGSISSTRGEKARNILLAAIKIENFLKEKELFSYLKSFYETISKSFICELNCCEDKNLKNKIIKEILKFLPFKFGLIFLFKIFLKSIFSIKNTLDKNFKIITIFSFEIRMNKRKNYEKQNQYNCSCL